MTDLSDTSTWLPLDGLAPGFDANRAPTVDDLHGRAFVLHCADGGTVQWREPADTWLVDEDLYYVQAHQGTQASSLFLDLHTGRALLVESTIGAGTPRVSQRFRPALIEGIVTRGSAPAPSTALLGRRVRWVYSQAHAYEHVYLTEHWYTWHCLAGPERGLADTDEQTTYELRPGIYVFAWREKVIPCAAVTVADHRDAGRMRSHGALFGLDESGQVPTHFTFGAYGQLLSTTVYPAGA
ncbi:molybdenum cofactor biosynthesis F family protein [Kutzneria viridogrisea]|uniref:Molybdenum cofactor biosynthesis protein F n=2 Tax=Kutzneria TaxID=43356 RepID=W5WDV5_9PSEU|nr:MoaF C-terminal domain-containing protein [Kutzneria albida]AHH99363.1 hypothetical protein KALB_6003 [Kutzneria albida DSM 43870]MBA8923082.1 hypothetical protein [Kutzneria viridogrisea]